MKIYLIISILLILNTAKAQEFTNIDTVLFNCKYFYEFKQDSTDVNSVRNAVMVLQVGKHLAKFINENKMFSDSILFSHKDEPFTQAKMHKILPLIQGAPTHIYTRYRLYYNYPKKGKTLMSGYFNKQQLEVIEDNSIKWKVEEESDTVILGYKCLKANTELWGRKFEAWFAPDIPIFYGPYKFIGLPGLVLKVSDHQNQHCFTLIEIKKEQGIHPIYFVDNNYTEVSPKDFVKALEIYIANLYSRVSQNDGIVLNSDETKARSLNNLKSRNNFIEKY